MASRNKAADVPAFNPLVAYEKVEKAARKTMKARNVSFGNSFRHAKKVHMKFNVAINRKKNWTGICFDAMNMNMLSNRILVVYKSNSIGSPKRAEYTLL